MWLGEVALARAKLEEGITLYDAKLARSHAYTYGIDPGVVCLSYAALEWWFLGFADHALDRSQRALALAEETLASSQPKVGLGLGRVAPPVPPRKAQHTGIGAGSHPAL